MSVIKAGECNMGGPLDNLRNDFSTQGEINYSKPSNKQGTFNAPQQDNGIFHMQLGIPKPAETHPRVKLKSTRVDEIVGLHFREKITV